MDERRNPVTAIRDIGVFDPVATTSWCLAVSMAAIVHQVIFPILR
jgi:hypothetical protein